jgi:peptide-methionine (R)-S-oxide reductase
MDSMMKQIDRRAFLGFAGAAAAGSLVLFGHSGRAATAMHFAINHTPAEWRRMLGAQRYAVLREAATERPFSSPLLKEHRKGIFACAGCALDLYSSDTKFDSGTGWPSFYKPLNNAVATKTDNTLGMTRVEVHCRRCGGHLGHVFDDGPKPTGLRYCMNGVALNFKPAKI